MTATPTPTPTGPVTLDDVRAALGDTDPGQTNASKVRRLLGGRGSFETIQRHLGTLRQEQATAAAPTVSNQVPAMPADAAAAMWAVVWTAAQVQTLRRSEQLVAERDAALSALETMGQDLAGYVETVDGQAEQIEQARQDAADHASGADQDAAAAQDAAEAAAGERDALAAELDQARHALATAQADAQHAAQIAVRDAEIAAGAMQRTIDQLTGQVGELKSLLHQERQPIAKPAKS